MKVTGFVTAGGRSSRMGRDKAWLEVDGRPMIERVIAALRPVTTSVVIIANDKEYMRFGLPVVGDAQPGVGPLEAIRTALANCSTPLVALAGCDLPFVTAELFAFLLSLSDDHHAVVPMGQDARIQPLCAIYPASALESVTGLIASGERKAGRLFDMTPTRLVPFDRLQHLPGAELFFENVNTPEQYLRVTRRISG